MFVANVKEVQEFDKERYVSKLLFDMEKGRGALFCLEPGQEVPAHTAPAHVIFSVVSGQGVVNICDEATTVKEGDLLLCPPDAPHGFKGDDRLVILAFIL